MSLSSFNRFKIAHSGLDIRRSKFTKNFEHKTTFKSGKLIPIYLDEIIAGDTMDINLASVMRSITPVVPVMDNAFVDFYFFFVPFRLCTVHEHDWEKICGENFSSKWAPTTESTLTTTGNNVSFNDLSKVEPCSLAHYMGLPIVDSITTAKFKNERVNTMPFVAYYKIWNEWFRDENNQDPIVIFDVNNVGDAASSLCDVNKYHDYFTSALPSPQKGSSVLLPIAGLAPVHPGLSNISEGSAASYPGLRGFLSNGNDSASYYGIGSDMAVPNLSIYSEADEGITTENTFGSIDPSDSVEIEAETDMYRFIPSNLWADLKNSTAVSVNDLRYAFALQRFEERNARGGTRYREYLLSHFGVQNGDLRLQVPEYLFGKHIPLTMSQVNQTSETGTSPLGATGAYSLSGFNERCFVKSFTEPGYILGLACVRTEQTYSQGLPKLFTRDRQFDFYDPVFANIGEQPIYSRELYLKGIDNSGTYHFDDVFGYNEAWAEYRFKANQVSGYLAPDAGDTTLTAWTYTNNFTAMPILNADFIKQSDKNIADTLVYSEANYQFIADFYFQVKATRPMPLYSIPGLIDHH